MGIILLLEEEVGSTPSFLWWHTPDSFLASHPSPDTSRLITCFCCHCSRQAMCAHIFHMWTNNLSCWGDNLRSCHKPSTLNPQYFYYIGSQMLGRQQCCQICLWSGWTSKLQKKKQKKNKKEKRKKNHQNLLRMIKMHNFFYC